MPEPHIASALSALMTFFYSKVNMKNVSRKMLLLIWFVLCLLLFFLSLTFPLTLSPSPHICLSSYHYSYYSISSSFFLHIFLLSHTLFSWLRFVNSSLPLRNHIIYKHPLPLLWLIPPLTQIGLKNKYRYYQ